MLPSHGCNARNNQERQNGKVRQATGEWGRVRSVLHCDSKTTVRKISNPVSAVTEPATITVVMNQAGVCKNREPAIQGQNGGKCGSSRTATVVWKRSGVNRGVVQAATAGATITNVYP